MSRVVIDELAAGWDYLTIQAGVRASLTNAGIDLNNVPNLNKVFRDLPKLFDVLETRFKHRESLHLVVSYFSVPRFEERVR